MDAELLARFKAALADGTVFDAFRNELMVEGLAPIDVSRAFVEFRALLRDNPEAAGMTPGVELLWGESSLMREMDENLVRTSAILDRYGRETTPEAKEALVGLHREHRQQAIRAIQQRNSLAKVVEDTEARVAMLNEKAEAARAAGDVERADTLERESGQYAATLTTARENLGMVEETAEAVKLAIHRERERLERRFGPLTEEDLAPRP